MLSVRIIAAILCVTTVLGCDKFRAFLAAESWKWSPSGITETKRRGDIVCNALDAYHRKNGKYPFKLDEIRPEFLGEIPQPTTGNKQWQYSCLDDGADYWLQVSASEFGPQLDKTARQSWQYIEDRWQ
jgi:hypothetical protein